MRASFVFLAFVMIGVASCAASKDSSTCAALASSADGGPGACRVSAVYLACTLPNGGGCSCLASDASAGCPSCDGATCHSVCGDNEYAASCGGPPSSGLTYADAPAGCANNMQTPGGEAFYCCPCAP